jgi:hypothetical protein
LGEVCGGEETKRTENQGDPDSVFHLVSPIAEWHPAILDGMVLLFLMLGNGSKLAAELSKSEH